MNYIASIHRGRFRLLVDSMSQKLVKSGIFAMAFNQDTNNSLTHCWSSNKRIGKKCVIGYGYEKVKKRRNDYVIPMFDHYNIGFCVCDKYNRVLHGKTWPHRLIGDHRVFSNYMFTCILINTYHLWIDAGGRHEDRSKISWQEFCTDLAIEMVM